MIEGEAPADAGAASRLATTVILALLAFTVVLVVLSFPAGLYAVFSGALSTQVTSSTFVVPALFIGPVLAPFPAAVSIGELFIFLTAVYALLFLFGLSQPTGPAKAVREAFRSGVGALTKSPFIVILVSIGFLNFSAVIVSALAETAAGPVGNPFSSIDPVIEFGSLAIAPLREEVGFRLVLIGAIALILSMGMPLRRALKSLWRPSAAYEGLLVGGATSVIIWVATGASALTFGVCHVTCGSGAGGWNWSKLPEATWGGVVLGYLYVKYGLHVAILTHWGVDYLGSAFSFFGQAAYGISATSTTTEYIGQYLVDVDMLFFFGLACFVLVVYLGLRKLAEGRNPRPGFVDKGPPAGGGLVP